MAKDCSTYYFHWNQQWVSKGSSLNFLGQKKLQEKNSPIVFSLTG